MTAKEMFEDLGYNFLYENKHFIKYRNDFIDSEIIIDKYNFSYEINNVKEDNLNNNKVDIDLHEAITTQLKELQDFEDYSFSIITKIRKLYLLDIFTIFNGINVFGCQSENKNYFILHKDIKNNKSDWNVTPYSEEDYNKIRTSKETLKKNINFYMNNI